MPEVLRRVAPRRKCSPYKPDPEDKRIEQHFCTVMWESMSDEGQPGIGPFIIFSMKTGTSSWAGLVLKKTKRDRGIVLNRCPFCGVSYKAWLKPHLKAA